MWLLGRSPFSLLRSFLSLLRDILRLFALLLRLCLSILSLARAIMYFFSRRQFWVLSFTTWLLFSSLRAEAQTSSPSPPSPPQTPTFLAVSTIVTSTPAPTSTPAFQFGDDCEGAEFMTSQQFASLSFLWRTRCRLCVDRWYEHNASSVLPTSPPSVLFPTSVIPTSVIPTSVIPTSVIPTFVFSTPSPSPSASASAPAPSSTPSPSYTLTPPGGGSGYFCYTPTPPPTSTPVNFEQVVFHRAIPYPDGWALNVYLASYPYDFSSAYLSSVFFPTYYSPYSSYTYYSPVRDVWHHAAVYVPLDRVVYRARVSGGFTFNRHLVSQGSGHFVYPMYQGQRVGSPHFVGTSGFRDPALIDVIFDASVSGSPADGFVIGFKAYPSSNWGILSQLYLFSVVADLWSFPDPPPPPADPCSTPTPLPLDPYCRSPEFSESVAPFDASDLSFQVESSYCYQVTPTIPELNLKGGWLCVDWVRFPRLVFLGFVIDSSLAFSIGLVGFILVSIFRR